MKVDDFVRERAVLRIFREHHRVHRGGRLSAREIERDWRRTGLRRDDLDRALADLSRRQLLQVEHCGARTDYALSYLGECAMQCVLLTRPRQALRGWLVLERARRRKPGQVPVAALRRAGDPKTDAEPQTA